MAGSAGPGPTMLASGKLPYADPAKAPGVAPSGDRANRESDYHLKERRVKQEAIALGYEQHGNQSRAIKEAGSNYDTFNRWIHTDPGFQTRMLQAHLAWRDSLQDDAVAIHRKEVSNQHPSALMTMFLLKGNWPEKYGDRIKVEDPRLDKLLDIMARQRQLVQVVEGELAEAQVRELPEPQNEASSS